VIFMDVRPPICSITALAVFSVTLAIPLIFGPVGCRDPTIGERETTGEMTGETASDGVSQTIVSDPPPIPTEQPTSGKDAIMDPVPSAASWLTAADLNHFLPGLLRRADALGFAAAVVQPDPAAAQSFLVVAPDQAAARQLNGFFYWFLDLSRQPAELPQLMLCLDRLFSDATRPAAMAGGLYSDPAVVGLLGFSLQQTLQDLYQPEILDFILSCYRKDFGSRRQSREPSGQVYRQTVNRIEVSYEAAIYSTVTFRRQA
jgi:hypothetical protein